MKKNPISYIFITSRLSRGLVALATYMQKNGIKVSIASPTTSKESTKLRIPHIRIIKISIPGKRFLVPTRTLRKFIDDENPHIYVLDQPSLEMARFMRVPFDDTRLSYGIDLSLFNPSSVAVCLQSRFLSEFNIAPHQKLVTVISPLGFGLDVILKALEMTNSDDLMIALYGSTGRFRAKKIIRQIEKSEHGHKITFIGQDADIATILRSSYAVMSLGAHDPLLSMAATSMGRPTIWFDDKSDAAPNIKLKNTSDPACISDALRMVLDLGMAERQRIEKNNLAAAKKFDIEKAVKKLVK